MNFKNLIILSGTSAFLLATSTVLPFFHNAAQAKPSDSAAEPARIRNLDQLNLTDAQKTKLKGIRESSSKEMTAILTPEQKEKLQTAMSQKKKPDLNLTEEQKTKIKALRDKTRDEMMAVLTPEQQKKLQELRQARKESRNKQ